MIDLHLLRADPEAVKASQRARGEDDAVVDRIVELDASRRAAGTRHDELRNEQKSIGKDVAKASGAAKDELLARARSLADSVKQMADERDTIGAELDRALLAVHNIVDDRSPRGGEDDFLTLEEIGAPPAFEAPPRDHLELGELLGAIDVERAAKVSGSRFYYLTGVGARLQMALVNLALDLATDEGFRQVVPPVLVKPEIMEGTGFLGQAAENVYRIELDDLYLVGTAEVPLAGLHADEILDPRSLPLRYVALSPCFRREAGSYGKDTRGIIRVHQFDKVEMFSFTDPAAADDEHQRLLSMEKRFMDLLDVPYRVIDVATGDLGASAARKFDIEAWIPTQGRYREVTSTSNCTSFQARRLGVRTRSGSGTTPVATLNGTLCAVPRIVVALLENHQRPDGSVVVPEALRPYLRGLEVLVP